MMWRFSYPIVSLISLVFFAGASVATAASDDTLVDTQKTAVATNLGLFGGQPLDITVDPTNGDVVYAATYTPNGIFFSINGGESWSTLPNTVDYGAGKDVVVDPVTGDAYALIGDEVIKTSNHGETWTVLTDNLDGDPLIGGAGLYVNDILLVAADSGTIQVSDNGGDSFSSVTIASGSSRVTVQSFATGSDGTFYAALLDEVNTISSLYRSDDNGNTWTQMDVEAGGVAVNSVFYGVFIDPDDVNHIVLPSYHPDYYSYHSLDGGATWTALQQDNTRIGGEEAAFDGNGRLYLGTNYTDNPTAVSPTWNEIVMDTPLSSVRGDIYGIDSSNPSTLFTNTGLGIAKSEDSGTTWTDTVDGMTALQTFDIAQANDKGIVWIGANGGLARSTNFTSNTPDWDFPILPEDGISFVHAVWIKPNDSSYVLAGLSGFISLSTDGGETWAHTNTPSFYGTVEDIVQSPNDSATLYAVYTNTSLTEDAYNGGVLMSDDFGATWTDLSFPSTLAGAALAVANDAGNDVLYVGIGAGGTETGVYTYRDADWEKVDEDFGDFYVNAILVHPEDNTIVFVSLAADSTAGSLYRSTDAGETFEQLAEGLDGTNHLGVMAAQPDVTTTIYLAGQAEGGAGTIYKSTDGGDSWSAYYTGLKQEFFYALLFDGLLSGNDRGLYSLESFGKFTIKANYRNHKETLRITLKDAATLDVLANRKLRVYQKRKGHVWKLIDTVQTNVKGKVTIKVPATKTNRFKVIWRPNSADTAEYATTTSRVVTAQ